MHSRQPRESTMNCKTTTADSEDNEGMKAEGVKKERTETEEGKTGWILTWKIA